MEMIIRRVRATKMQKSSSLILHRGTRVTTTGGTTEGAARIGEAVMMLGSQATVQMQKGGGVALISNTNQSDPAINLRTSSRTQVSMNEAWDLQLQDHCTGSAATTGAPAPLVTLSCGILPQPQLLILTEMNDYPSSPQLLSCRNSLLSGNSQQVEHARATAAALWSAAVSSRM